MERHVPSPGIAKGRDPDVQEQGLALWPSLEVREALLLHQMALIGELSALADAFARQNAFTRRQETKAWNTVRKEIAALTHFMVFLGLLQQTVRSSRGEQAEEEMRPDVLHLAEEPRLWSQITYGLVDAYLTWMIRQGYSIKTINDYVDVAKLYARLAYTAGHVTLEQLTAIKTVPRLRGSEGERIDEKRPVTRLGHKKAEPTFLSRQEFRAFLDRPDTAQGWRDRVAILLMYDLSLRPSEVVSLKIRDVNLEEGTINIVRHKTHDRQRARLKDRLFQAMRQYLRRRQDTSPDAPLLVRSLKSGDLVENLPREAQEEEAARRGGRRPSSPAHPLYARLQPESAAAAALARGEKSTWTPPLTTRGLREHLHELGLDIADDLYGEQAGAKKPPRTKRQAPGKEINLTSYDGRHEWTRSAVRGGSNLIMIKKAGGWKGHSPMVERYFGELDIINDEIVLER